MEKIIELSCLEHIYRDSTNIELCGLDFTVVKGEKVAILGPNGGGKTTLVKHLIGLLSPSKGTVRVFGLNPVTDFNKVREKIGVVLQSVDEQLIGPTVFDDVLFSPLNYNYPPEEAIKMATQVMEDLDITHLKDKVIHYLSGGEKRKVALAGALVLKPELLILDEPFVGLDVKSQIELIKIINRISDENKISVVLTTHDVELVPQFADTMYLISSGNRMSQKGTPKEIFSQPELLETFNLHQPSITRLFDMLNKEGKEFGYPLSVEEAFKLLNDAMLAKNL